MMDYYPCQKVAYVKGDVNMPMFLFLLLNRLPIPSTDVVYTILEAQPCEVCGAHISLKEIGPNCLYPSKWFRPVELKEMEVLRGLLSPENIETVKHLEEAELWREFGSSL